MATPFLKIYSLTQIPGKYLRPNSGKILRSNSRKSQGQQKPNFSDKYKINQIGSI